MSVLDKVSSPATNLKPLHFPLVPCAPDSPIAIYQVHLDSWMRVPEEESRPLTYFEIAPKLAEHAAALQFTHVQLHSPDETDTAGLRFLTEILHRHNLGVIVETFRPFKLSPARENGFSADGESLDGETHLGEHLYHWDRSWAEEIISYFATDPLYRKYRQHQFTHRDNYEFGCNYILPLSHQLATRHGRSLLGTMPGDPWRQFANLRLLFAYQYLIPGKKLIFMGSEFGQQNPWRYDTSLDWHLVDTVSYHGKTLGWVANLNRFYRHETALHQTDSRSTGFQWIDTSDAASSVISFLRRSADGDSLLLAVLNFTPVPRHNYRVGVPRGGYWSEVLNSDAVEFGGSGQGNLGGVEAAPLGWNFKSHSLMLTLPPLAAIVLKAPA